MCTKKINAQQGKCARKKIRSRVNAHEKKIKLQQGSGRISEKRDTAQLAPAAAFRGPLPSKLSQYT